MHHTIAFSTPSYGACCFPAGLSQLDLVESQLDRGRPPHTTSPSPDSTMQRFRPLLAALPTLRTRAAPPSALPFLRFSSSSPAPGSHPSPAPAAPTEPKHATDSSKDSAGGFTKPKKEGEQPELTYFVPRTSNGELVRPVALDSLFGLCGLIGSMG